LLPIVVVGLCALLTANMAARDPRYLVPFALIVALTFVPAFMARWRMRKLLRSGDVKRVLGTWAGSIERVMYPETMAPLMAATAYASYGWVEAARDSLDRAVKGPAWDAALEQRLFVETLLDTFEGDRAGAMQKAAVLAQMPMPKAGPFARKRVDLLRRGLGALARAFAHQSGEGDAKLLGRAAGASPLVHWAMRYAAAIVAVDHAKPELVRDLLEGAPEWPRESAFRNYHDELLAHAAA
jgi:hypothetical protein